MRIAQPWRDQSAMNIDTVWYRYAVARQTFDRGNARALEQQIRERPVGQPCIRQTQHTHAHAPAYRRQAAAQTSVSVRPGEIDDDLDRCQGCGTHPAPAVI